MPAARKARPAQRAKPKQRAAVKVPVVEGEQQDDDVEMEETPVVEEHSGGSMEDDPMSTLEIAAAVRKFADKGSKKEDANSRLLDKQIHELLASTRQNVDKVLSTALSKADAIVRKLNLEDQSLPEGSQTSDEWKAIFDQHKTHGDVIAREMDQVIDTLDVGIYEDAQKLLDRRSAAARKAHKRFVKLVEREAAQTEAMSEAQSLPTAPAISFFWATPGLVVANYSVPSCSSVVISLTRNENTAAPIPPFHFIAAPVGGIPENQQVSTSIGGRFTWDANFAVGTSFVLTMTDNAGNSGGSVGPYTMVAGTSNCTLASNVTPITFTANPPDDPCGEVDLTIKGGVQPYTVSVLAPGIGLFGNLTGQSNDVKLGNSVANSQDFFLFVTDSTGTSSVLGNATTSRLGDTTCVKPLYPSTSSSPSIGAIVGGVVGGLLGAITLFAIAFFYLRRKKASQAAQDQLQDEMNTSAEYRMADGNAPRVTPFLVPARLPSADPSHRLQQHLQQPQAYMPQKGGDSPSTLNSPASPDFDSYQSSHPPSSVYSHAPILPYPSPPPSLPSPYHSYEHQRPSSVASDPRTGLDHPDGFQYRDATPAFRAQRSRSEVYD